MIKLIPGRHLADQILKSTQIKNLKSKICDPVLAVILVGKNPASRLYVSIKQKKAKQTGLGFKKYLLPTKTSQTKIINLINQLNRDPNITAMIIQLPLPGHLNTNKIICAINPAKDADGLHPQNLNLLKRNQLPPVLPATTGAILEALKYTKTNLTNKSVAIIGKSKIAGLPTYYYLKPKVKSIHIYDSSTKNLPAKTAKADILIVAVGQPKFITAKYVKPNAIVVDVGINKINGRTVGDVNIESVKNKARWITSVPGGIGPITVAILLRNVIDIARQKLSPSR